MKRLLLLALILAACQPTAAAVPAPYTPVAGPFQTFQGSVVPAQSGVVGTSRESSAPSGSYTTLPTPAPSVRPPYLRSIGMQKERQIAGQATWWNSWGHGLYAAAGPRLRAAMGPGYLHRYVTACARGVCVRVRLITSCACSPDTRLIDLSADAFARLAPLGLGILLVEVTW